jgi:hypothetical protein
MNEILCETLCAYVVQTKLDYMQVIKKYFSARILVMKIKLLRYGNIVKK